MKMEASQTAQILTWRDNHRLYGLELDSCREVKRGVSLTRVPCTEKEVCGIVNLRGEVVTVYDLRVILGFAAETRDTSAIIRIKSGSNQTAIATNKILDLVSVDRDSFQPLPANATDTEQKYLGSICRWNGEILWIVNPAIIGKNFSN